jgi:hypothetical protein
MSFAPKYPEIMPVAFAEAIDRFHDQRDKETRNTWSGISIETEEATFLSIAESVEVATAVAKLEKAISINPEFWERLIRVSVRLRENLRTTDKRTNREKIAKLQEITASLEHSSKLIHREAFGTWSPSMGINKIFEESRPYDQLLLDEIATKPVRVSLANGGAKSGDQEFSSQKVSVSSGSVSKLCGALSESITELINEIGSEENEIFFNKGHGDRRYVEAEICSVFEDFFPNNKTKPYEDARAQTVVALAKVMLDLREDKKFLDDQFKAIRSKRPVKKKTQI